MIINDTIKIKNYKCFNEDGGGFESIFPINVIIGKNNSGKSTLIDVVQHLVEPKHILTTTGNNDVTASIHVEHLLNEEELSNWRIQTGKNTGYINDMGFIEIISYSYLITAKREIKYNSYNGSFGPHIQGLKRTRLEEFIPISISRSISTTFENKKFCKITAERDIIPENKFVDGRNIKITPNGTGAANTIEGILNMIKYDSDIIEVKLLDELNKIINPEIKFSRILVQEIVSGKWEVFFVDFKQNRIALSKMGSGIKTILLVLLNLIVRPVIEKVSPSDFVFAFEELENNLHPALQRRLYEYIKQYSISNKCYFFITTHSNVVIDTFGICNNSQIIHVKNDGTKSITEPIISFKDTKGLLEDLGIKASDLIQSNGIIWVEGPSDRVYIKKWLELKECDFKEGLHYSIMFYGGKLLANLSLEEENDVPESFVELVKVNKNAFVILDRDGENANADLNKTKKRIIREVGDENTWVSQGREIENYLRNEDIILWLTEKELEPDDFILGDDENLKEIPLTNGGSTKYNTQKAKNSREICQHLTIQSLDKLNLMDKLDSLISKIESWNN